MSNIYEIRYRIGDIRYTENFSAKGHYSDKCGKFKFDDKLKRYNNVYNEWMEVSCREMMQIGRGVLYIKTLDKHQIKNKNLGMVRIASGDFYATIYRNGGSGYGVAEGNGN